MFHSTWIPRRERATHVSLAASDERMTLSSSPSAPAVALPILEAARRLQFHEAINGVRRVCHHYCSGACSGFSNPAAECSGCDVTVTCNPLAEGYFHVAPPAPPASPCDSAPEICHRCFGRRRPIECDAHLCDVFESCQWPPEPPHPPRPPIHPFISPPPPRGAHMPYSPPSAPPHPPGASHSLPSHNPSGPAHHTNVPTHHPTTPAPITIPDTAPRVCGCDLLRVEVLKPSDALPPALIGGDYVKSGTDARGAPPPRPPAARRRASVCWSHSCLLRFSERGGTADGALPGRAWPSVRPRPSRAGWPMFTAVNMSHAPQFLYVTAVNGVDERGVINHWVLTRRTPSRPHPPLDMHSHDNTGQPDTHLVSDGRPVRGSRLLARPLRPCCPPPRARLVGQSVLHM